MTLQSTIEHKLTRGLNLQHMEVSNESNQHNVPPGSESHFKLVLVSNDFADKMLITRHRMINDILAVELQGQIHALSMHTYIEQEWQEKTGLAPQSPPCLGGGK